MTYNQMATTGLMFIGIMPHIPESPRGRDVSILLPSASPQPWITGIVSQHPNHFALANPIQATALAGIPIAAHSFLNRMDLVMQSFLKRMYGSWRNLSAMASTVSITPLAYQKAIPESSLGEVK